MGGITPLCTQLREAGGGALANSVAVGATSGEAFGWERPFLDEVAGLRQREAATILEAQSCRAVNAGLYFCTTALATFGTYACYFYTSGGADL